VPLVRHQHLLRAREQGEAQPRAPRDLARAADPRAPDRHSHGADLGDEGRAEGPGRAAHHARLRAREHEPERGLLGPREEHARGHRLRRRLEQAGPAQPGRDRPPAAPRDRRASPGARAVHHRRDRQGRLGAAVRLLGRDLRGQRGRRAAQGARVDLRAGDSGGGRLRPGEEGL
ncbi:MAG: Transcription antitermination protein NusG, partial [uncultured Solirubrobacterales bacterium]